MGKTKVSPIVLFLIPNMPVLFSICIPAYKRPENIDRLLSSILIQTFNDYEVIITDDSGDDSLKDVLEKYSNLPIKYFRNEKPLGTPANWNYSISLAKGEWIKIMHEDDWFADERSLAFFAEATSKNKKIYFLSIFQCLSHWKKRDARFPGRFEIQDTSSTYVIAGPERNRPAQCYSCP